MDSVTCAAIDRCINYRIPFIAYILPQEDNVHFFANPSGDINANADAIISFFGHDADSVKLYAELDAGQLVNSDIKPQPKPHITPYNISTTRQSHHRAVEQIASRLQRDGGKTVLSRTITGQPPSSDIVHIIETIFAKSLFAFRFVYYTQATGCWFGASPELLGELNTTGRFSTMALAGTRTHGTQWDDKNREENQMVVDYITSTMTSIGINAIVAPEETVSCGPVEHLRHIIYADINNSTRSFNELISQLNPTPALAGYPLANALADISLYEDHPRYCYGGYIAINLPDGTKRAYVNLRSCHINENTYCIYAGGGITAQSNPDLEWLETEAKAAAILRYFDRPC